jgi:hypothetical protein
VSPPTDKDNFLRVATALLDDVEGTAAEVAEWAGCENARFRAAVSRAYYTVLLEVKYRVIDLRPEWRQSPESFPRNRIHGILADAIRAARSGYTLSRGLRQLSTSRKDADYVWDSVYRRETAERELDLAHKLLRELSRFTTRDWQAIADRLHSLDR